ncbi:LEAF RUST 10 DISEASE-RESISTANCE LOCUS RECEPTOR-LIKE PROTEIN KINASE-like 2.5 isoform X2 [Vigna angularis]|uniref:LEAF RUST 10 DISEASE-RESISTANCE LOCUS RECEPTOR-LIKE PROTEIN KINASE-like 2.5 isoform X2 n=1 Tax=Phaseolus angularis TaxID=3914 RepID=UPI0022B48364|nr:LEAF RUST 10 DISEASE-RESISTANCE LOCUS RECEPTOR-LIKE PROTEIN KINASE-like 2.5 isoform X2 [Vigna angularis]
MYANALKLNMFCRFTLFFLFSATVATLLLPTTCHVNLSPSTMPLGQNQSKIVHKVGDVFMGCDDRKNCSSNVDNNSAYGSRILNEVSQNANDVSQNEVTQNASATTTVTQVCKGKSCVTNSTSQTSVSPVSSPNLKSPSPSSSPLSSPPTLSPRSSPSSPVTGVVSAVTGGLFFILFCLRRKSSTRLVKFCFTTNSDSNVEAFLRNHGAIAQKRYKFSEVQKMTNSFKVKLGQGGFGTVYKGTLLTGSPVAVKLLKASKRNDEEFINEVASISRTSHVNIVSLVGFCLEGSKKALIYEFMANGSLDKFIYNRGPENIASLTWENLYQIAIGIARGLEYLHRGCNTKILHFDIKPHNILLDENFCPKISDFGLAKLCPRNESIISVSDARGTMGYLAPEMINRHFGGVSQKSDVYSYGMMLLEMVGGRKNINPEASHTSEIYFPHFAYRTLDVDNDVRPYEVMNAEEDEIAKRMTVVGLWCIQSLPNDRPTMSRVVDMLEDNMNSLEMPPKPLFSSPTRSET